MKAIHNYCREMGTHRVDVVTLSKIEKMKAIHNTSATNSSKRVDVVTLSKIEKMKAIHNYGNGANGASSML